MLDCAHARFSQGPRWVKIPRAAKQQARHAETFADLAKEYMERHAKLKRSCREDHRMLYGSSHKKRTGRRPHVPIVRRWGTMKVREITRRHVRDLLDDISTRAQFRRIASWPSCARCSTSPSNATGSMSIRA